MCSEGAGFHTFSLLLHKTRGYMQKIPAERKGSELWSILFFPHIALGISYLFPHPIAPQRFTCHGK